MQTMLIERRSFLRGLFSVPIAIGLPAIAEPRVLQREPYVRVGEYVDCISLNLYPQPVFTGTARVVEIGEWNGKFYPCVVNTSVERDVDLLPFPDHDLCSFLDEVPRGFWGMPGNWGRFPNVHSFVRFKRFGESPLVMRARMEAVRLGKPFIVPA